MSEILKAEDVRRVSLETKAKIAASVSFASSVFVLDRLRDSIPSNNLVGLFAVAATFMVMASLVGAYQTHAVARSLVVDPGQYCDDDIHEQPVAERYRGVALHLQETIRSVRTELDEKAQHVLVTQEAALWTIVFCLLMTIASALSGGVLGT